MMHSNHVKYSNIVFRNFIGKMFTAFLRHAYMPKEMLRGHIKPRLKDNKTCKTISENYRPVMSSSILLKLFEYCLVPVLSKNLKISSLQFGFTKYSSCANAITLLKETVMAYKRGSSNVHVAALDLSKAYDRINIKVLIDKLLESTLPVPIIKILHYMLSNSHANVKYANFIGEEFLIQSGVRQGGVLSSIIFNYYINDCLEKVASMEVGCKLNLQKSNIIGYADDIIVLAPSVKGLQKFIDVLHVMLEKLCLKINKTKSVYMVFKGNMGYKCEHSVRLGDHILTRVNQIKYLGVIITYDLSLSEDITRTTDAFLRQFNGFYHKFNFLQDDVLFYLFRTYSMSFYGINLWVDQNLSNNSLRKIATVYHKGVKRIAGKLPWDSNHEACSIVKVNLFKHLLTKRILSHYIAMITSNNYVFRALRYYLICSSELGKCIANIFSKEYGVKNFRENDIDAVKARVDYVERNEPRSFYNMPSLTAAV